MQRRRFLCAMAAGSGLIAGCIGGGSEPSQPSPTSTERTSADTPATTEESTTQQETSSTGTFRSTGGDEYVTLSAEVVEPPTGATVVNASDNRLDEITPIQEVIEEVTAIEQTDTEGPQQASVTIDAENATEVDNALNELPQHGETTIYYIRHGEFVIKLTRVGLKEQ